MQKFDGNELRKLGTALFGEAWTGPMSRRIGVTGRYLRMLASGERPIPPALLIELEALCNDRIKIMDRWHARLMDLTFGKAA